MTGTKVIMTVRDPDKGQKVIDAIMPDDRSDTAEIINGQIELDSLSQSELEQRRFGLEPTCRRNGHARRPNESMGSKSNSAPVTPLLPIPIARRCYDIGSKPVLGV